MCAASAGSHSQKLEEDVRAPRNWTYMASLANLWRFWEPFQSQGLNLCYQAGQWALLAFSIVINMDVHKNILEDILIFAFSYGVSKTQDHVP